jgi:hypothetical protein
MSEPKTPESETPTQNLSARDIAALLLAGAGVVVAIAVEARGVAAFVAWLAIFGGLAMGFATKSAVVRFGGAFIVSLVVVTAIAAVVRRGDGDSGEPSDAPPEAGRATVTATTRPPETSKSSTGESAEEVARQLGGGTEEAERIRRIADFYDVEPKAVAGQAANAAKLCLKGEDIGANPGEAIGFAAAGLLYVDKVTRDTARELDAKSVRKLLPLTDAWVTYVSMGCPQ